MTSHKAQAATEYIMIIGFLLLILTPIIYLVYTNSQEYSQEIGYAQVNEIGVMLVDSAESMYYYGKPSRVVVEANMPPGITEMSVFKQSDDDCTVCNELRFNFSDNTQIIIPSSVEIRGIIGDEYVDGETHFTRLSFSQGLKRFQLAAQGDYVELTALT